MDGISQEQPAEKKPNILEGVEWGLGGVMLGVGTFLLMLFVLNYFNIVSLSLVFPNQLAWLPHKGVSSGTPQSVPTGTPSALQGELPLFLLISHQR